MALMDFIKKQFIDVIDWTETDEETLSWRFPMQDREIQNGAMLTVRESQLALFVNEGVIADLFQPGMYRLNTGTLPLLTNLQHWDKLFASPFKSDVYFFSTRQKLDRKWGTPNPVTIRDKDFGMVRLRAFGIYAYRLADAVRFHGTVSGTTERYTTEKLEGQLRNSIVGHIADLFGESGVPFIDMAANQEEFGRALASRVRPLFEDYGLQLDSFTVQSISLPEELQAMLDKRISVNMMGGMQSYTQLQAADAIGLAARNEGGLAGVGAGVGVGLGVGQQMAAAFAQTLPGAASGSEAKVSPAGTASARLSADEVVATLEKLHGLVEKGILSAEEFAAKKAELLSRIG